ncbi:MAG: hypothetical protein ABUL61_05430, partial [Oleiharenicola lentus]
MSNLIVGLVFMVCVGWLMPVRWSAQLTSPLTPGRRRLFRAGKFSEVFSFREEPAVPAWVARAFFRECLPIAFPWLRSTLMKPLRLI